jgi:hypothetical protein
MNWELFSLAGYISVALLVIVPMLWLIHLLGLRWSGHVAVGCAVIGFVLAGINSRNYVARIAVDQSDVVEQQLAARELARRQAEAERAADAADIRFAEDAAGDQLDTAGLDDTDLAFFESFDDAPPAWKNQKKTRDETITEADDLEALIGGTTQRDGVEVEGVIEVAEQREPIYMSEADMLTANRIDKLNLSAAPVAMLLAVFFVMFDYVRRLNRYPEAYCPLPVPSHWADALTPRPAAMNLTNQSKRSPTEELAFITRRGEVFIYFTDHDRSGEERISKKLPRLPGGLWSIEVLDLQEYHDLDDRFVFETLWFGRNSFVLRDTERAIQMLSSFSYWLDMRHDARARTRRTVHLVWNTSTPIPEPLRQRVEFLCKATGFTLLLFNDHPKHNTAAS